jgi:hypothetical protein
MQFHVNGFKPGDPDVIPHAGPGARPVTRCPTRWTC